MSHKIGVIIGSSRPTRIGGQVTEWVVKNLPTSDNATYEIIDLAEWNLPFFDEPNTPSSGKPVVGEHTKKWKAHIDRFQAFVFVTAEYNAGYPAPLKNALDYLKAEWKDKPSLVISYGWDGGTSANNQLKEVLTRIGTKGVEMSPALGFSGPDMFDADDKIVDVDASYEKFAGEVKSAGQLVLTALEG